jgi:hypothetical protein
LINSISNKLNGIEFIDFDCYYRIIEILNEIFNEYEKFSHKILPAIAKNKEDFITYTNNLRNKNLEKNLDEVEKIGIALNTNEKLKKSIKEEDRLKMKTSLNNYRKKIDEMLNLIYTKINDIYSKLNV